MAKILLVEDDNNLREIYEARLQAEGYAIVSARDGEEALVVAKAEQPDLVISDVMMPKISGFEMLDILRNTEGLKEVKVVMLTALGQSEDQSRADSLGADRYLVKSQVTLEDIVNAAKQLLSGDEPAAAPAPVINQATTTTIPVVDTPVAAEPATTVAPEPTAAPVTEPEATPELAIEPEPAVEAAPAEQASTPEATPELAIEPEPLTAPVETVTPQAEVITDEATTPETAAEAAPATDPVTVEPSLNLDSDTADTLDQEESIIEKQLTDFVTEQTGNAPLEAPIDATPAPAEEAAEEVATAPELAIEPEPTPAAPVEPVVAEAAVQTTSTDNTPEQEKALADAVNSLSAPASGGLEEPNKNAQVTAPTQEPKLSGGSNKKIIAPLGAAPQQSKKSLEQLLAEEDAQAGTSTPPAADTKGDFDPNSIAL